MAKTLSTFLELNFTEVHMPFIIQVQISYGNLNEVVVFSLNFSNCLLFVIYFLFLRALGFAATRGKLYYRHPELFKVNTLSYSCNIAANVTKPVWSDWL